MPAGEVTVLVGANGSGKTTLMRGLAGHGELTVDVRDLDPPVAFYYVHQQPERALFPTLSVHHAFYALVAARRGEFWSLRRPPSFDTLLASLPTALQQNLSRYVDHDVAALSGGYKALLAVAAAAVAFPECGLLLDEPSAGLDVVNRQALASQLATMAAERSTPVVVSTHQQDFASALGGPKLEVVGGIVGRWQAVSTEEDR